MSSYKLGESVCDSYGANHAMPRCQMRLAVVLLIEINDRIGGENADEAERVKNPMHCDFCFVLKVGKQGAFF